MPIQIEKITHRKPSKRRIVFLVWAPHSMRAESMSESLGSDLYLMSYKFRNKIYSPIKYPLLFLRSFLILKNDKPEIVFCQNPPIFCSLSAVAYKLLINKETKLMIDMHSGALEKPWSYLRVLNNSIMKKATAVIVSNPEAQENIFVENKIRPIILEDKIPDFDLPPKSFDSAKGGGKNNNNDFQVVVPSSFAYDEPIDEILNAAAILQDVKFYLTGDSSIIPDGVLDRKTANVIFTGFLEKEDYVQLLYESDAVIALTTRGRTLLAGAYEAVALQKPLITSKWLPLQRYFNKGTIHVDNSTVEIIAAIERLRQKRSDMEFEMNLLKEEKVKEWKKAFARVQDLISS